MTVENPLSHILIREGILNEFALKEMREHIERSEATDLSVFDPIKSNETGETHWRTDKNIRDTQIVEMGPLFPKIQDLMKNIVEHVINPFYEIQINESEVPQILSYGIGGHYQPHIDGESLWQTPDGQLIWKKSTNRDISMVLYLNDDFEGGDFVFPDHNVRVRPKPGMLVCFPSNHHYKHGVEPVTRGKRYSMVCWMQALGFPTMEQINEELGKKYNVVINN